MVSEGALPVVWCMRDNQLVPHQVSGVKLQGVVTGAHIAAVTDFLRMVAGTPIVLPHTTFPEDVENDVNEEKENTTRQRKISMQVEVPCVFLSESALQKAKSRHNSLEEKVTLNNLSTNNTNSQNTRDSVLSLFNTNNNNLLSNKENMEEDCSNKTSVAPCLTENITQRITRIIDLDNLNNEEMTHDPDRECPQKITRIIEFEDNHLPVSNDSEIETPQKITRIIEFNDNNLFSNSHDDALSDQKILKSKSIDSVFPSMAKIIEIENEKSNERRISLTSEREIGCGLDNCSEDVITKFRPLQRSRFSVDSSCSENSYANIETIKSLQDDRKEDILEIISNADSQAKPIIKSRFRRKKSSVCSIGSSDCDDEVDVIFKSKPKSSQWVSLDWIPPHKEEPVNTQVCDKNDFISKWIAEQNSHSTGLMADERRRSLPPKSNEIYLQTMRRFSDGLQMCKEDAASDSPATVKWKWHDLVKRHLQLLKNDKGFRRQRGSWMRTARRLSHSNINNNSLDALPFDTYMRLNAMP
ncbi:unnamed protein product [Leptosia nina]|uniref:Uncharacterized protein n=1 Tax=Leptosia nina TaxID=320188 RepID=A0AAV1JTZ8_9NEOP